MPVYYVDFTNGVDTLPGLREPTTSHYHAEASSDATHTVCATSLTGTAEDATGYVGAFIYNRTRGAGAIISAFVHSTHTLTHDSISGNAETDEFYVVKAWKTFGKAATTLAAGDIAYVRAGTTDTLADNVAFTNDGTDTSHIQVIGIGTGSATLETTDETATEAWHDASTTRPIVDVGYATTNYISLDTDTYWNLKNFTLKLSRATTSSVRIVGCLYTQFDNCIFRDFNTNNYMACHVGSNYSAAMWEIAVFNDCSFLDNLMCCLSVGCAEVKLHRCDFNGITYGYGITTNQSSGYASWGKVSAEDCLFSQSAAFTNYDVQLQNGMLFVAKNCKFQTTSTKQYYCGSGSTFISYNHQKIFGNNLCAHTEGTITSETTVVRDGGGETSIKIMPSSVVNINRPISIVSPHGFLPDFKIWCPASETTITVYIRSVTTWGGTYPTASQLRLEASYISNASSGSVASSTAISDEVLSDGTTWVGFSVTITPAIASFVDLKIILAKYTTSNGIYVDIKPVIS